MNDSGAEMSAWTDTSPHPWRRYAARTADTILLGFPMWVLLIVAVYWRDVESADSFLALLGEGTLGRVLEAALSVVIVIPACGLLIGLTGSSLGKWIFGVRVTKNGAPIGIAAALQREISIWIFGWGLALPIVCLFTAIRSYVKLKVDSVTRWDESGGYEVTHRPQTLASAILMWIAAALIIACAAALRLYAA